MEGSLEFFPLVSEEILWPFIIASCLLSFVLIFTRKQAALLRILCLFGLVVILANPHIRTEERHPLKNIVLVVVDESISQSLSLRPQLTKLARDKLSEKLGQKDNLDVRWEVVRRAQGVNDRTNSGTLLFSHLNKALSKIPKHLLSGIFIITDGQIHDIPKVLEGYDRHIPIHAFITGHNQEHDQRIEVVKAPRFGIIGSQSKILIKVMQDGVQRQGTAKLKIFREGYAPETRTVAVGTDVEIPIYFNHAGTNLVEIEVEPTKGELTHVNNKLAIAAEGVRENLRVLLVSGEPHSGERTWRNLLKSDAAVDLVHFTILRPPEKQDGTPINQLSLIAFPTRELFSDKLSQFDLIIFDRYRRRGVLPLLYLDNITRYVEQGGAVLVAAGKTFATSFSLYKTPLSQILPGEPTGRVIEKPYRAIVTDEGGKHPVTRNLPGANGVKPSWGHWFRLVQVQAKNGRTLMKGADDNPLLLLNRVGKGRVALLVSDHAWLWARGFDGGGPYRQLLRRLSHWLMKQPDLEEEYLTAKSANGKIVIERRSMLDKILPVEVLTPNGDKLTVELTNVSSGVWQQTISADAIGLYKLTSGDLTAVAQEGLLNSVEMANVSATDNLLQPLFKRSSGNAVWLSDIFGGAKDIKQKAQQFPQITLLRNAKIMHGKDWLGLRDRNAYNVRGVEYIPVLWGLIPLMGIFGLFALLWYREGH